MYVWVTLHQAVSNRSNSLFQQLCILTRHVLCLLDIPLMLRDLDDNSKEQTQILCCVQLDR